MSETGQDRSRRRRLGKWFPPAEETVAAFRLELAARAYEREGPRLRTKPVRELCDLVQNDAVLRMDLTNAIGEALEQGFELGYRTIEELMCIGDFTMSYAPPFSESSLIHCLLNAVLDWPMCMPSGYALFRDPVLNAQLKRVLNCWSSYLSGPHSRIRASTFTKRPPTAGLVPKRTDISGCHSSFARGRGLTGASLPGTVSSRASLIRVRGPSPRRLTKGHRQSMRGLALQH